MDKRDFTVIENETKIVEKQPKKMVVTNPIAKKFVKFHSEKSEFSVKELFKNVPN